MGTSECRPRGGAVLRPQGIFNVWIKLGNQWMKPMKLHMALALLCGSAACVQDTGDIAVEIDPVQASIASVNANEGQSFETMLNGVRGVYGAEPLSYDARLGTAALAHAQDMYDNDFFSHTGSDGLEVGDRVSAAGYSYSWVGENIAKGQQTEADVLRAWVNSPGHQENNVRPQFEDFALARVGDGFDRYWVLVFASPR